MKAKKALELLNEDGATTAGVATFVGRSGVGVDSVFAGGFHPDYGEIGATLQGQLSYRKQLRKQMIDAIGEDNLGDDLPVGGYFDMNTDLLINSYKALAKIAKEKIDYSEENTPEHYVDEWEEVKTNLKYDAAGEAYKIRDIFYDDLSDKLDIEKWTNKTNKMQFVDIYKSKGGEFIK